MANLSENTPDATEARDGARQKVIATGLLLLAGALFAATFFVPQPGFWTMLARHITEASLAGGVADWFAVVALFRRPLGLPIPHTAVIPRNKDRIARGLARFVETHFLEPATVADRLRRADISGRAARWLTAPDNAALVADRAAQVLAVVIASVPDAELRTFVRRAALRGLSTVDLASLLGIGLRALYESGRHQELFDEMLGAARRWIARHPGRIRGIVQERTAWWVPKQIDRELGRVVAEQLGLWLEDLAAADSDVRGDLDRLIARLIEDLHTSPRYAEQIEALKRDLLSSEQMHASLDQVALEVRRLALEGMAERRSEVRAALGEAAQAFGRRLAADEGLRKRLERRVVWLVRTTILPWRHAIGRFMADVMRGWETRTVAERLEAAVSRDLQYVRINGTLVGGLVGGVLFLLTHGLG